MEKRLGRTVADLVRLGERRAGTDAGARAAAYIATRFAEAGLENVRHEPFAFPRHEVLAAELAFAIDGHAAEIGFDVLEAAGSGSGRGRVVPVGGGTLAEISRVDLAGALALVARNPLYHRSAQYEAVARAGAAAMVVVSTAPFNLRQVGSVRRAWEPAGLIPAFTIGAADGALLTAAARAGRAVFAKHALSVDIRRAQGQNVIAELPGARPERVVIGAHFDSWFGGATDNAAGVAALVELAERMARGLRPSRSVSFVAWDGEELALYGGYHFLRTHFVDGAGALAVICLETPASHGAEGYGLARSCHAPLDHGCAGLEDLFALSLPMDLVPELFGGIIPTDIQGLYRHGAPTLAVAGDSPYYHTVADTPDKVDYPRLAALVDGMAALVEHLHGAAGHHFAARDAALWQLGVELDAAAGGALVRVTDSDGIAQAGIVVDGVLFGDDFFPVLTVSATSGPNGACFLPLPRDELAAAPPPRWFHVTAGPTYPRVERVLKLG
jgi:hypothetical protein